MNFTLQKTVTFLLVILGIFISVQYLLPLVLPFLLGAGLALSAEPMVQFFCEKVRMPRAAASGIGVSMAFSFLALAVMLLCALVIRELKALTGILPDMETTIRAGMDSLSRWLLDLVQKAPSGLAGPLRETVSGFFSGGSALLDRATDWLLTLASGILSHIPSSALGLAAGIISSFMISARLPQIRLFLRSRLPLEKLSPLLETLKHVKSTLLGWLKAQLKLSGVTFLVALTGFLLLRISHAPLWAAVIAVVDALPILGSGTALIPWSLVSFLQGDHVQAFGLLGLYGICALTRSILEPRLLGKQLGLDPLVTLMALYAGYRLWGFGGMILAPMLAVAATQLTDSRNAEC